MRGLKLNEAALAALSPVERQRVLAEFQAVEREFERNPLWGYRPHAKQAVFHSPRADGSFPRIRLYIGGNRAGKTTSTHVDSIIQCVDRDAVPDHLKRFKRWDPPFYCRVVGPDLTRWLEGVALQKFREWCPREQLKGNGFERAWDKQQVMLRFKNGSWVQFMSNDQDLDKFAGAALHRVVYDEPPRQDIRGECMMRLIDYGGEELYGLTPTTGMSNWLYEEFYAPWERLVEEQELSSLEAELQLGYRLELVDMDDNPTLSEEDKAWALSGLNSQEREARKTGRFISFAGLIYPEFDRSRHVLPAIDKVPEGVEVFCGIDAGFKHPAVLYCYLDFEDRLVVFDEIAPEDAIIDKVVSQIRETNARWNVIPGWYVIDPAARNRNSQTGQADQLEFALKGISTIPGQNDVRLGIDKVKERFEGNKLFVTASCPTLLGELRKYRWRAPSNRSEDERPERPVKKDDHCVDALRYVVMRRPMVPLEPVDRPTLTMKQRLLNEAMKHFDKFKAPAHPSGAGMFQ